jgi:solute:Na+ symporter, SSS family
MTILTFSTADWLLAALYLGIILYLGFRKSGKSTSGKDFLLGGRMLSLPAFVAALVATWYGGVLGVGEFTYMYGLANWLVFGAPYYLFALIFAFFFARKIRESQSYSISDILYSVYDKKTGLLGSALVFFVSSPAPYILMLTILLQVVTGWGLLPSLLICTVTSLAYVYWGGFRAVVRTDIAQFILMFGGFIVLLVYLVPEHGILPYIPQNVPAEHITPTGGNTWQYIVVWFFIALWTLVSPPFHQFTLNTKSPQTAKWGIVVSVICWMIFDGITTLSGLYARALLPNLADPALAFPALAEQVLPSMAKGLFYIGMLGTVMSTVDGFTFVSAITVGRDIIARFSGKMDDESVQRYTKIGVIVTAITSVASILLFPSIVALWYIIGTLFIPALLLPIVTAYYDRFRIAASFTFTAMLAGFGIAFVMFMIGTINATSAGPAYPFGIEPMYPGLVMAVLVYVAGNILKDRT